MSRYVDHKHGLTLGSGNVFFVIDRGEKNEPALVLPEGVSEIRDGYRAIVSFGGYSFKSPSTANCFIRTPAYQLVWKQKILEWETPWVHKGETIILPQEKRYDVVNSWFTNWLEKNVGPRYEKWDTYTRGRNSEPCLFFKRRKDALAAIRMIQKILEGIKL